MKDNLRIVKEIMQGANVRESCKVRIDSCNITDNRKFHKRKTYSEVVAEKKTERQDEKFLDLEMNKEKLLRDEVLEPCVLFPPLVCYDTSVSKNSSDQFVNTNSSSVLTAEDEEFVRFWKTLIAAK